MQNETIDKLKSNLSKAWVQLILIAQDDFGWVELDVTFERWSLDADSGIIPHEIAFITGWQTSSHL